MRPLLILLLPALLAFGCKTVYYPRAVNYSGHDLNIAVKYGDGRIEEWVLAEGEGRWFGRKKTDIYSISITQGDQSRTLNQAELAELGANQVYAIRGLDDIQKIK